MHELSLVLGIVDLVKEEAARYDASSVESINLEIGELAGVDWSALEFAWKSAIPGTLLENAECKIKRVEGRAKCLDCGTEFHAPTFFNPCPNCGQFLTEIKDGRQFRVKSFTIP